MNQNENQNYNNYGYEYEEIDLREIFKTLAKWKKVIAGITLGAMFLSAIVSLFILTPVYEAKTDLIQTPSQTLNRSSSPNYILKEEEEYRKIEESSLTIKAPAISLSSYKELVYSSIILERTIEKLGLELKPRELREMIKAEQPKDFKNICITVSDPDPELAALIANTLADELITYINEMEQENFAKVIDTLQDQINNAQKDLDNAVEALKDYRAGNIENNGEADLVRKELEEKKLQNEVNRREDLVDLLNTKMMELKITQAFMETEDNIIVLSEAYVPENPIKPNKTLNVAIAGVLGFMLSIFGVFLAEYLRKEE